MRKKVPSYVATLKKAMQRLKESDTQLKRRNARKAMRLILNKIWRNVESDFPGMNADGTLRVRKTRPKCPVCGIPSNTWMDAVNHVLNRHERYQKIAEFGAAGERRTVIKIVCWCGQHFDHKKQFAKHLQALDLRGELTIHTAIEALRDF